MNHVEGGWGKDINMYDAEQTLRYKKKVEKDEEYIHSVLQLSHVSETYYELILVTHLIEI